MSWGIRGKIVGGFLLVLMLLLGSAGTGLWTASSYTTFVSTIAQKGRGTAFNIGEIRALQNSLVRDAWRALIEKESGGRAEALRSGEKNRSHMNEHLKDLGLLVRDGELAEIQKRCAEMEIHWANFVQKLGKDVVPPAAEQVIIVNEITILVDKLEEMFDAFSEMQIHELSVEMEHAKNSAAWARRISLSFVALGMLFVLLMGRFFARAISSQLRQIASDLRMASDEMIGAGERNSEGSQKLAASATETAASLEETSASVEVLSRSAEQNAAHSRHASELVAEAGRTAQSGADEVSKLVAAMGDMALSSKKIEEISAVIDSIAFQTNLLALNAAVEAARAGEQGKGFAVVAEAVRSLAQKSSASAKEISVLIEETVEKSTRGVKAASGSGETLQGIVAKVAAVTSVVGEISEGSHEQAISIAQLSKALQQLDMVNRANASGSEEFASTGSEFLRQASLLREKVIRLEAIVEGTRGNGDSASHPVAVRIGKNAIANILSKKVKVSRKDVDIHAKNRPEASAGPKSRALSPSAKTKEQPPSVAHSAVARVAASVISEKVSRVIAKSESSVDPESIIPFESDDPAENGTAESHVGSLKGF